MSKTVVLDAGHGGSDPGAVNGSRYESHDTLRLAKAVQQLLEKNGQRVVMTRTGDVHVSLNSRTVLANGSGADLFVSLHRNSFGDSTAQGTEIWVYTTAGRLDEAAAGAVLEELDDVGIQSNRGVKKGNYHVLRESSMTSMLVELGFVSNTVDNRLFDRYFDEYAEAIARGVCTALGEPWQGGTEELEALYKVQVGAFRSQDNAKSFLATVRSMGLDAFLIRQDTAREG